MLRPLIGILLTSTIAMAGGQDRGGATVIVCFDKPERMKWLNPKDCVTDKNRNRVCKLPDKFFDPAHPEYIQMIELIDYYEAKMKRSVKAVTPRLIESGENEEIESYVARLIERMDKYISPLSNVLLTGMRLVNGYRINTARIGLPPIVDLGIAPTLDENRCVFSNLIIQQDVGPLIQVQVDERLMDHPAHKKISKNLSWVHEYLYSYLRTYRGTKVSLGARTALKFLATEFPVYDVDGVVSELLSTQVLPLVDPAMADGFLLDGRRPDQVSTFEENVAQQMVHFLDEFSNPMVLDQSSSEEQIQVALALHFPKFEKIPLITPELLLYIKVHLYNIMATNYDPSKMIVLNSQFGTRELSPNASRRLTTAFFKSFHPRVNILIR